MLSLGNLATLLGGKFPNHRAIWPHFLLQVAKKKKKKGLDKSSKEKGNWSLMVIFGNLQTSLKFLGEHDFTSSNEGTWGNHVCP